MGGPPAQRLTVGLTGLSNVLGSDRREREKLDGVDLYLTGADPVAATALDPRPLPQPDRKRDVSGQDVVAQLRAELHARSPSAHEELEPGAPGAATAADLDPYDADRLELT